MYNHFEKTIIMLILVTNYLVNSQKDKNEEIAHDNVNFNISYHFNNCIDYFAEPVLYLNYHPDSVVKMATKYLGTPYKLSGKSAEINILNLGT